jgi:hypothetical protein
VSGGHHHHHDHDHHHQGGDSFAVLDIGGDVGALVATMYPGSAGTELFLRPASDPTTTVHTGVWDRRDAGTHVTAALFPELPAGIYHVLDERGRPQRTVEIFGGAVATIDLRH